MIHIFGLILIISFSVFSLSRFKVRNHHVTLLIWHCAKCKPLLLIPPSNCYLRLSNFRKSTTITKHKTPMTVATNRTPPRLTAGCHVTKKVKDCSEHYLFGDDKTLKWNGVVKVEEKGIEIFMTS